MALLAVLAMILAACGADDDATDTTVSADSGGDSSANLERSRDVDTVEDAADGAMAEAPADDAPAEESPDSGDVLADADAAESDAIGSGGGTPPPLNTQQLGREIIFTATINVGVDDVAEAGNQATDIINDIGGFVFGQNTQGGVEPRSTITFKVRPEDFSIALERLGGIGELRNQTVTTDDVTERVVDLNSRIEVAQLGVNRLREAMENTTTLTDFAELENLLLSRESDLEVMRGQLRTIRDRIDLATITLTLEQDRVVNGIELLFTVYEGHDEGISCPGRNASDALFEPGDEVTLCFESRNAGDQPLTDVNVTETVLGLEGSDLITVFGDTDDLQPGQTVIQAWELTAERDRPLRVSVTATPTDGVSTEPAGPAVRSQDTPVLRVNEDAVDPGFSDGFDAATDLLKSIWLIVVVLVGFIIPLLVLVPFLALAWFAIRRLLRMRAEREAQRHARALEIQRANTPPPPATKTETSSDAERSSVFEDDGRSDEEVGSEDE
ncbi:MAG: DUF4349 domain-containing protein [Acidimicrobiia bacterium]|nr:DUF4349 domain-containing protein [Acidimicrobiia bacterium]